MKISKMFKRIASMGMALALAMSCAAISAGAADTTKYTVTADVYVAKADNYIKLVDAHLTDTAVPPIHAPEQNGVVEKVDNGYNVTVQLKNETLELKTIADTSAATDDKTAKVLSSANVPSKSGKLHSDYYVLRSRNWIKCTSLKQLSMSTSMHLPLETLVIRPSRFLLRSAVIWWK